MGKKKIKDSRPSWDDYFMHIVLEVKTRSTCLRRHVSAVLVKDKRIISTGYNGAPSGVPHCLEVGCLRTKLKIPSGQRHEICRGLHAEQNAIIQAALNGVPTSGATCYCTIMPCVICIKMLINAGIKRIVYIDEYPDDFGLVKDFIKQAKIKTTKYKFKK